jgi:hypothetical protein
MLLAIDPGMNSPGVALFSTDGGTLIAATHLTMPEDWVDVEAGMRWLAVARQIRAWIAKWSGGSSDTTMSVVFEKPQWYQRGKSKGDPNQLVGIAGVAANLTGILSCHYHLLVKSPTPSEWIGQLSKVCTYCQGRKTAPRTDGKRGRGVTRICKVCNSTAWGTPRGRYIQKRLTAAEIALVPDQNDAIDAVGIGLWALGRLTPQSVFSNGRDGR